MKTHSIGIVKIEETLEDHTELSRISPMGLFTVAMPKLEKTPHRLHSWGFKSSTWHRHQNEELLKEMVY